MKKCLIIGSTVCDVILYVDKLPTTQQDIHPKKQVVSLGGCAFNVAHVLHHLKVPYTLISPVGSGMYGDFVKQHLQKQGMHSEIAVQQENGCCYCMVENSGERSFMSYHGAEYTFDPAWLRKLDLNDYAYAYVCGLEVEDVDGMKLVNALASFQGQIIFAPGPRGMHIQQERLDILYGYKPIMHLNDLEIEQMMQEEDLLHAMKKLYTLTQNKVIVTVGKQGVYLYDGNQIQHIETSKVEVVDTIGAGDSHVGGYLVGKSLGYEDTKALSLANRIAGKVVSISASTLSKEEYAKLYKELSNENHSFTNKKDEI